jgi:hypothetical protein
MGTDAIDDRHEPIGSAAGVTPTAQPALRGTPSILCDSLAQAVIKRLRWFS